MIRAMTLPVAVALRQRSRVGGLALPLWFAFWLLPMANLVVAADPVESLPPNPAITNLTQVRDWMWRPVETNLPVALNGEVVGVFTGLSLVILHDESGNAGIRLDLQRFPWLKPHQLIRVEGLAHFGGGQASLLPPLLLDNDGLHPPVEVSGPIFLTPGRHPFRLNFFQLGGDFALKLEYDGPGIPRQPLPASALTHVVQPLDTVPNYAPGLEGVEYDYYEGAWNGMPDFNEMTPVKSGFLNDIESSPRRQDTNFAFRYNGDLQIEQPGEYHFYLTSDDGSQLFLQAVPTVVKLLDGAGETTSDAANAVQAGAPLSADRNYGWSMVEGTVDFVGRNGRLWRAEISSQGSHMELLVDDAASQPTELTPGNRIRATGFCVGAFDKPSQIVAATLLVAGTNALSRLNDSAPPEIGGSNAALPVLTTAEAVRNLPPVEAARGYPVRLRGVITVRRIIPEGILQDFTSAVYVFFDAAQSWQLRDGDYCELTGLTAQGGFANIVKMQSANILGRGTYPEPLHPDYPQLAGGSMDCQWVELQGLISRRMDERHFQLTVKGGLVSAEVQANSDMTVLAGLSNAFVRVRGAVIPGRNEAGEATKEVYLWIPSTDSIRVDQSASTDPFQSPLKQVAELSRFDPNPNYHQFSRVRGQILLVSGSTLYFTDGTDSLLIQPKAALPLVPGDLVEAVGLPDLLRDPPRLIEAMLRKIGHAPLPAPPTLDLEQVSQGAYSGHSVRVEGQLVDIRTGYKQGVLVIQSGLRNLQATGPITDPATPLPPLGSWVSLCGVVKETGNTGETELLLNSLADVTCLKLPPFWTQQRVLLLLVILTGTILLAASWILLLRRTVSKRTQALLVEMNERQIAEKKVRTLDTLRALETERARISRNIHDDLGARVTKLSRLAAQITVSEPDSQARLDEITSTSRQMVEALDETVWTVNPVNDSLPKLANYLAHYAAEFFHQTSIRCELDLPLNLPDLPLSAEFRFNFFLATKEALNNVLKHAQAQSVLLKLVHLPGQLQLTIQDDGRGFAPGTDLRRSGLANLQTRVAGLGGQFTFQSAPGAGTTIFITVPLPDLTAPPAPTA